VVSATVVTRLGSRVSKAAQLIVNQGEPPCRAAIASEQNLLI
jgi:hypothetical protein